MEFICESCRKEHQEDHHDDKHRESDRCRAISDLIRSVAEEQEALARILEAEHKKIEKAVELCHTDADDLIRVNRSVEQADTLQQAVAQAGDTAALLATGEETGRALADLLRAQTDWLNETSG